MSTSPSTHLPGPHSKAFGDPLKVRKDNWIAKPSAMALLLISFLVYSTWAAFQGPANQHWVNGTLYLSPFFSPEVVGTSPHAWHLGAPSWWPSFLPLSASLLILAFPAGFRLTCYYYRKAYYRSIWLDPAGCAIGEPRNEYWGENRLPLILWNAHRYMLYFALIFVALLTWDGLMSFWYPVDAAGKPFAWTLRADGTIDPAVQPAKYVFGLGLGSLFLMLNPVFIALYTFGCHSLRHLVGGRKDSFGTCATDKAQLGLWRAVSRLNGHHHVWAMVSLVWVAATDVYVRLSAAYGWKHWFTF